MTTAAEQVALNGFWFWDCLLMPMPTGKKATNLRDLLQYLPGMGDPVLKYHLWQSRLTMMQPSVEYPNDFALWAVKALHDPRLAEKLSAVDPFDFENMSKVREALVELLEDYLWEYPHNPQVQPGFEFYFCEAAAVVMPSGIVARTLGEFCTALRKVGIDSIFYHFYEARWRLGARIMDDFSRWLEFNFPLTDLVRDMREIDIYFYNLSEVRETILALIAEHTGVCSDQA